MSDRDGDRLFRRGLVGTIVAAVCCFTPVLVVLVAGVGLSAIIGGLDYVLFPMLFASLGVVAYALYLRTGCPGASPRVGIIAAVILLSALLFWLEFRYALRISLAAAALVATYGFYLNWRAGAPPSSPAE